jgi:hypothetical protein
MLKPFLDRMIDTLTDAETTVRRQVRRWGAPAAQRGVSTAHGLLMIVSVAAGLLLIGGSVYLLAQSAALLSSGERTRATVLSSVVPHAESDDYVPVVRYTVPGGAEAVDTLTIASEKKFEEGSVLPLLVAPRPPHEVHVNRFGDLFLPGLLGLLFGCVSLGVPWYVIRKR